ncbi:MAG: CpaD family pilus assembly protein [Alphaproteobacteria bacterium]|nr:CpaD family pilus assembly protein [Alphaproteobacteria bacterium]
MTKDVMRLAALAAVLLAGSCAAPGDNDGIPTMEPTALHPIAVHPEHQTVRLSFSGNSAGLAAEDEANLDSVVRDYLSNGDGSLSVSVPEGPESSEAITYFGERLAHMGVPRSRILVGTHPVGDGDRRVEVGFIGYVARAKNCGDWSENLALSTDNMPSENFGCAVQNNIAAMVANPRDLDESRRLDDAPDAARRAVVLGHYEKGEPSQAVKHTSDTGNEQSAPGSDIGN